MKSKLGAWSFAFAFLLSLALPASAGYIQVVGPATPQTPWASSWSGYFASDYSDISSFCALPEPNGLALAGLALAFAVAGGRTRSVRGARRSLR